MLSFKGIFLSLIFKAKHVGYKVMKTILFILPCTITSRDIQKISNKQVTLKENVKPKIHFSKRIACNQFCILYPFSQM